MCLDRKSLNLESMRTDNMDLVFLPAYKLLKLIKSREISPVDLVVLFLKRIRDLNPSLNAFLTVLDEEAVMEEAMKAEKALYTGQKLGLLHGIPVSIKDLQLTKGVRTTFGSLLFKDFIPDEDSNVVERLKAQGAIVLGKTNTPELGQSATTENKLGDHCRNPWNTQMTTGGSSGGAAASIAAGLCCLAQGSDGGGSIRIPSSFCGVYGLKPSFGRVADKSEANGMPFFAQIGPITRYVQDAALMLDAMSGPDSRDYTCIKKKAPNYFSQMDDPTPKMKIAWSPDLGFAVIDPEVRSIVESAVRVFEDLGHRIEQATPTIDSPFDIFNPIALADTYLAYGFLLEKESNNLMGYVKSTLIEGSRITGAQYSRALQLSYKLKSNLLSFFEEYDLLMTPTVAIPTFPVGKRPTQIAGQKVDRLWGPFPFTIPCPAAHPK